MLHRLPVIFVLMVLLSAPSLGQRNSSSASGQKYGDTTTQMGPKEILQRESPAIVAIFSIDKSGKAVAQGSGFIVRADGVVVTNYHVVENAQDAQIRLKNGEIFENAIVLHYDVRHDVVILKIQAIGLPVVTMGSAAMPDAGDRAYAIGNPEGFDYTISDGLISAHRVMGGTEMLQITVPISHGSSGGPLYNLQGQVIGITTAGFMEEGAQNLNFAVPMKYVLGLLSSTQRNITLAQLSSQMHPTEQAQATRPSSPDRLRGSGGPWTDPTGLLRVNPPSGWKIEDPPPKDTLLSMSNSDGATVFAYQADGRNVDDELATQKKVISKEYGTVGDCSKVEKADNQDRRMRVQICVASYKGKTLVLTFAVLQSRSTMVGILGISDRDSYKTVIDAIGSIEF